MGEAGLNLPAQGVKTAESRGLSPSVQALQAFFQKQFGHRTCGRPSYCCVTDPVDEPPGRADCSKCYTLPCLTGLGKSGQACTLRPQTDCHAES